MVRYSMAQSTMVRHPMAKCTIVRITIGNFVMVTTSHTMATYDAP